MPIIPTYRRQERYQAPGVQTGAPVPQRLGRAYENTLQEFGSFSSQALAYLQRQPEKEEKKGRSSAAASGVENRLSSLSFEKAENTGGQAEKSSVQADEDLQLRLDLASSVRERVSEGRAVEPSDLDEFAAQRLTPQQADTPAARDYLMLRRAAQEEQALQTRGQNIRAARQEENLVRTVGATASSAAALDAYLEAQLPALEKRLQENGSDPKNLARQLAGVRAQTALENVRRSVAAGNYSAAPEVFSRYEKEMTPRQREECREKIRLSAAEGYANRLWNRAQAETDGTPEQCNAWARQQLTEEKQADLKTDVQKNLDLLAASAQQRQHQALAQVYRAVASAQAGSARAVLNTREGLASARLSLVYRAAQQADGGVSVPTRADTFNTLYFSGTEKEIDRAFEKNQLSARDYCLLQAVLHERAAGAESSESRFLARGIENWGKKNELSVQETAEIKYKVLSADGGIENQRAAWQRMKALLEN